MERSHEAQCDRTDSRIIGVRMEKTYVGIMIQSLQKKIKILEEIHSANIRQQEILEDERGDVDDFDKVVEEKAQLIEQMELLDSGFEKLFERVKEELDGNKDEYKDKICTMQTIIRKITDLSMEIQAQEARNRDLMIRKFTTVREKAKEVRTSAKVASQYYKNMMQLNVLDPQFMDNKK